MAQKKGLNLMADVAAFGLAYQHQGLVTTRKYIREHPEVVKNFVKSDIEAVHRIKTDRQAGIRILARHIHVHDKDVLEKTYDNSISDNKLPPKQYPTLEGLKTILDPISRKRSESESSKAAGLYRSAFCPGVRKAGFIDALYGSKIR